MSDRIYKIVLMMKRRPGMSVEDFRRYYESQHAPLCEKYSRGLLRYVRRYLDPQPHPENGPAGELPFDVITELWFDDRDRFEGSLAYITTSVLPDDVVEDEGKLFDRGSIRIATVVECETPFA